MRIQLLTRPDCPNAGPAREALRAAMALTGIAAPVEEVDLAAPGLPESLRGWASPTILVDGIDAGGRQAPDDGDACRLYAGGARAPGVDVIGELLRRRAGAARPRRLVGG